MKIITVVGARPQFIKAAVVSRAIQDYNHRNAGKHIEEVIIHTGQHYDIELSDIFFSEMQIPEPRYRLGVRAESHGAMTGRMMEEIETVLMKERPDIVLVYGDTNSTLAGALAAVKLGLSIAHVEAGLRSFNRSMPEEINRVLTDRISRWLFCPTETAVANLRREGLGTTPVAADSRPGIYNVGDVMYDATLFYREKARLSAETAAKLTGGERFYLSTIHRAENTDDIGRLKNIISALDDIAAHTPVLMPLHPRTAKILKTAGITINRIITVKPVGYFEMIALLSKCCGVFTDSGGLQKEAYFFGKQCVTIRDETEWVELVEAGCNRLTGADYEKIVQAEKAISGRKAVFPDCIYGQGDAGARIVELLAKGE